jgi:hypothetical protein
VIDKDNMMGVLIEACPSFVPAWEAFLKEWEEDANDLPLYLALAELARHLCGMLARDETTMFSRVFGAVERLLVDGDQYVQEAACVGLLEDLQNANLHSSTAPEQFRPFLGPEAARCWSELDRFWRGADGSAERGAAPDRPRE